MICIILCNLSVASDALVLCMHKRCLYSCICTVARLLVAIAVCVLEVGRYIENAIAISVSYRHFWYRFFDMSILCRWQVKCRYILSYFFRLFNVKLKNWISYSARPRRYISTSPKRKLRNNIDVLTTLLGIMKHMSRPKSAAVKDIDIKGYRYRRYSGWQISISYRYWQRGYRPPQHL